MRTDDDSGRWAPEDPWRPPPRHAFTDDASTAVVEEAAVALTLLRSPMQLGDRLAELHALASLLAEIDARLPAVVAAALDQGHSWQEIAGQLDVTAVRRRYRTKLNTKKDTR